MIRPVPLSVLAKASPAEVQLYGGKVAGNVQLHQALVGSPVPYRISPGFGVKPRDHGGDLSRAHLSEVFDSLVGHGGQRGVLMARSSSLTERPGHNPTVESMYDRSDREGSFARFVKAAEQVFDTSSDMGMLLTHMVGEEVVLEDGTETFGWSNRSFVADSHSPIHRDQMYVAAVHGSGHTAVDSAGNFVGVMALRKSAQVIAVLNRTREFLMKTAGSTTAVYKPKDYSQRTVSYVDLHTGAVERRPLTESNLNDSDFYLKFSRDRKIGVTPFTGWGQINTLLSVLQYLGTKFGPVQIEGCFLDSLGGEVPTLYQLLRYPQGDQSVSPLSLMGGHLLSDHVIGKAHVTAPLIAIHFPYQDYPSPKQKARLREIDERYKDTGYILVAQTHSREVILSTPNCKIRVSLGLENFVSHVATDIRMQLITNPGSGYVLVTHPNLSDSCPPELAKALAYPNPEEVVVIDRVTLESNGESMALVAHFDPPIDPPKPENHRRWWHSLWPF